MALYQKITITDAGAELISGIILNGGNPLTFEAVAVGSGELVEGATPAKLTGLIQEAKRLPIETVTQQGGIITVTARLATDTITADLYHREVGVYANGVLLAYGNTGDKYDYIPAAGNNAAVQKIIRVPLAIGTMQTSFAEMDTTDLVTHAALEARVASVVEPIVRGKVTAEMAEEALDEAVRVVAREVAEEVNADAYAAQVKAEMAAGRALVSETNIDRAIDDALFTDGTYRTAIGTLDFTARSFEITKPQSGRITQIDIPCRSTSDAYDKTYKGTPVYLSVFERDLSDEWHRVGISTNAVRQTPGAISSFTFDGLYLSGRPIRLIVVTSSANTAFDTSLYMGARVISAPGMGIAYEESSLPDANNYLVDVTFTGANVEPKYAAADAVPINGYEKYRGAAIYELPDIDELSRVVYAVSMYTDSALQNIDGLSMRSVVNTAAMCMNCTSLTSAKNVDCFMSYNATSMYQNCTALTDISGSTYEYTELTGSMFRNCPNLTTTGGAFFGNIVIANGMFAENTQFEEVTESVKLGRLQQADDMFKNCILNLASVKHIASSINHVASGSITIGINAELQGNSELEAALKTIRDKGWGVTEEYNVKTA